MQVFFQRAYITISINPHFLTIGKTAFFELDYRFLYHMFIFLLLLTYIIVSFMTVQVDFIGVFLPTNNLGNPSNKMSEIGFFNLNFYVL